MHESRMKVLTLDDALPLFEGVDANNADEALLYLVPIEVKLATEHLLLWDYAVYAPHVLANPELYERYVVDWCKVRMARAMGEHAIY